MDALKRLAANVRRYRKATGKSQETFAHDAEIDRTYVSGVERGKRNPSVTVVERFAKGLGVDVADLLREPDQKA